MSQNIVYIKLIKSDIILYPIIVSPDKIQIPCKSKLFILHGNTRGARSLHSMAGIDRKRRFIYREARGAAAWRPAVMRIVPSANGREATLRGRDRQSQAYVRSIA